MGTPKVEVNEDHLRIRLDRIASITTLTGDVVVPYSSIASVEVGPPEWPPFFPAWRVGVHMPPAFVAKGRFASSFRGPRRFLWLERRTTRVLRLRLAGHPQFSEVQLDVPDAEALRERIESRRGKR